MIYYNYAMKLIILVFEHINKGDVIIKSWLTAIINDVRLQDDQMIITSEETASWLLLHSDDYFNPYAR